MGLGASFASAEDVSFFTAASWRVRTKRKRADRGVDGTKRTTAPVCTVAVGNVTDYVKDCLAQDTCRGELFAWDFVLIDHQLGMAPKPYLSCKFDAPTSPSHYMY